MKKVIQKVEAITLTLYKSFLSPILSHVFKGGCRFEPTCSQYSLLAIKKYGPFKGLYKSVIRVISCNPLSKHPRYYPLN